MYAMDLREKKETVVIALDLEDTYNMVQFNVLMCTLARLDVDPTWSCGLEWRSYRGKWHNASEPGHLRSSA